MVGDKAELALEFGRELMAQPYHAASTLSRSTAIADISLRHKEQKVEIEEQKVEIKKLKETVSRLWNVNASENLTIAGTKKIKLIMEMTPSLVIRRTWTSNNIIL